MKPMIKALLLVPLTFLVAIPAQADHGHGRLENRLERQQDRIDAGIDSGALTHKEARALKREQKQLRKMARKMRKDGRITKREGRKLNGKLEQASHRIREYKHNDRYRVTKTERSLDSRHYWHNGGGHQWSYELNLTPRYGYH